VLVDFQTSTFQLLILATGAAGFLWQLVLFALFPEQLFTYNGLLLLLALVVSGLAYFLLRYSPAASLGAWSAGTTVMIGIAIAAYDLPLAGAWFVLAPMTVLVLFGLPGGIASVGLSAASLALLIGLAPEVAILRGLVPNILISSIPALIIAGVLRYAVRTNFSNLAENFQRARVEVEEARLQRVEFKQIQEDLMLANRELARLSKQLKFLNQAAEEARRSKEDFVATVSHELRTPLNMIIGFSEVIAQSPEVYGLNLPPTLLADIVSIQRNSQHLLELVNDVLDLSQADMGSMAISCDWCSIQRIVDEAFDVIRPLFTSKGLYLSGNLPAEEIKIYCDVTRIREVTINLLSNAGRFTEKGGVVLEAYEQGSWVTISVKDTGPGISAENQKKLFEPFQQLDSSIRRQHGGSGLGLAISKRFVEVHGGQMWLESKLGVGTTVSFSLPVQSSTLNMQNLPGASRWFTPFSMYEVRTRPFKAQVETPSPQCVIYEEGQVVRRLVERYLGNAEAVPAGSLEEALDRVNETAAPLFVINHPRALEMAKSVVVQDRLPFGTPLVMFWLPEGKDLANQVGASGYLVKPISKDMLLGCLEGLGVEVSSVLLVDDNPEVLQLFSRILASAERKYRILRSTGGAQALELLRKRRPDAMILDLIMPEISGFDVLKEKASDPTICDIPVVLITAQDPAGMPRVGDAVTIRREGGFTPRDLLGFISYLLEQRAGPQP
jgi:signal transduction histidine kinase/CheY-like chemotaxis protein